MERKKMMIFIGALIIVVVAGLGIIFFASKKAGAPVATDESGSSENGQVAGTTTQHDAAWIERLAKTLTEKGMVLYGAYWCTHCKDQKAEFGDALKYVDYVECDPSGPSANVDECSANNIKSYPTWVYQGQKVDPSGNLVAISDDTGTGTLSLDKLAEIVGFEGN